MSGICPCCGHATDDDVLLVSLDTNRISRAGITVRVTPQQAELMYILKSARVVPLDTILSRLYGAGDEPEGGDRTIKVHLSRLRRVLSPLGVSIENVRAIGYRLVLDEAAPTDEPLPEFARTT